VLVDEIAPNSLAYRVRREVPHVSRLLRSSTAAVRRH
jgi:hypothetical protein